MKHQDTVSSGCVWFPFCAFPNLESPFALQFPFTSFLFLTGCKNGFGFGGAGEMVGDVTYVMGDETATAAVAADDVIDGIVSDVDDYSDAVNDDVEE